VSGVWHETAALAIEILSPNDTWEKLPFFAVHEVDELLIVDPDERTPAARRNDRPSVARARPADHDPKSRLAAGAPRVPVAFTQRWTGAA